MATTAIGGLAPEDSSVGPDPAALLAHLVADHGRERRELERLPAAAVHRFEHLEHALGLIELRHGHAPTADRAAGVAGQRGASRGRPSSTRPTVS